MLITDAVMGIVDGGAKLVPGKETLTASAAGVTTVAFAVADALADVFTAFRLTAYVPAAVPIGAPLPIVTEAD